MRRRRAAAMVSTKPGCDSVWGLKLRERGQCLGTGAGHLDRENDGEERVTNAIRQGFAFALGNE